MEKERLKSEAGRLERLTGIEEGEVFRGNGGRRGDVVIEKRNDC